MQHAGSIRGMILQTMLVAAGLLIPARAAVADPAMPPPSRATASDVSQRSGLPPPLAPGFTIPRPARAIAEPTPQGPPISVPRPLARGVATEPPGWPSDVGQTTAEETHPTPAQAAEPPASVVSRSELPTLDEATFARTLRAAERYREIASSGGWRTLPEDLLGAQESPELRAALKQRLLAEGDLAEPPQPGTKGDALLRDAIRRFQSRHGLITSGMVDRATLAALNVPARMRYRQLAASAERLAAAQPRPGDRYLLVNIPGAAVEAVENGRVARRHAAVVGRPDRPSPQLQAQVTAINLNPSWTVPASIIRRDIIPYMRRDPDYLARHRIRMFDGRGREIDPHRIDWLTERAADFTLRQDPGAGNSLGRVRIDMPNRQAIYLHDTPEQDLFVRPDRFHSSGCVRVAEIRGIVDWLLTGHANDRRALDAVDGSLRTGERRDIVLDRPVPVILAYLTGYATGDGTVHFREDIYDLDTDDGVAAAPAAGVLR